VIGNKRSRGKKRQQMLSNVSDELLKKATETQKHLEINVEDGGYQPDACSRI